MLSRSICFGVVALLAIQFIQTVQSTCVVVDEHDRNKVIQAQVDRWIHARTEVVDGLSPQQKTEKKGHFQKESEGWKEECAAKEKQENQILCVMPVKGLLSNGGVLRKCKWTETDNNIGDSFDSPPKVNKHMEEGRKAAALMKKHNAMSGLKNNYIYEEEDSDDNAESVYLVTGILMACAAFVCMMGCMCLIGFVVGYAVATNVKLSPPSIYIEDN